jgi:hypothetical protein
VCGTRRMPAGAVAGLIYNFLIQIHQQPTEGSGGDKWFLEAAAGPRCLLFTESDEHGGSSEPGGPLGAAFASASATSCPGARGLFVFL